VGGWRRLHNEELHNLYTSPNTIRVIKSRIIWVVHIPCIEEMRYAYIFWLEHLKGRDNSEDLGNRWQDNVTGKVVPVLN
jgi:hypothetical protein